MLDRLNVPLVAVVVVALAGCDSTTDPPVSVDPTLWTAELVAEGQGEGDLAGTASVASTPDDLEATVEIVEGAADAVHAWFIGEGECGEENARIGDPADYPHLELDEEGAGVVETELAEGLDPEGEYHVAVLASDEDHTVVACGALVVED